MKKQRYILFAIPLIIVLTIVILIIISQKQSEFLYCDPAVARGDSLSIWQETLISKPLPTDLDNVFFDKIEITSDANFTYIEYPSAGWDEISFPFELHKIKYDQSLKVGEGILELSGTGVAYCDANHVTNTKVPYKFYNSQLQPEIPENIEELWHYQTSENDSQFRLRPYPFFKFGFKYKGVEDLMFNGIKIFDGQTHKLLTSGYSSNGFYFEEWKGLDYTVSMPIWHYTPIDFVLDISFGPSEIFEFPAQVGEGFTRGDFDCRLKGIIENIDVTRTSSSSDGNKTVTQLYKSPLNNKGTCFLFVCIPVAHRMPVTFEFLDENGQVLDGHGTSTSNYIHDTRIRQPLEKIATIRAKYRTNRYRVVVHLPYIPGLPEQNNNIENLFDVHIPYIKLNDYNQINNVLREVLQLRNSHTAGQSPSQSSQTNTFPMVFKDRTLRDIAEIFTIGGNVNADVENDTLEIKYPMPLITKLKMLFVKMRNNDNE